MRPTALRASLGARQEDQPDAVLAGRGQLDALPLAGRLEEACGHLDQDAGAVAGVLLAAAGPAVLEVQRAR